MVLFYHFNSHPSWETFSTEGWNWVWKQICCSLSRSTMKWLFRVRKIKDIILTDQTLSLPILSLTHTRTNSLTSLLLSLLTHALAQIFQLRPFRSISQTMLGSRAVISLTLSLSLSLSLILSLSLSLSHAHLFSFSTPVSFSSCPDRAEVQFYFPVNYSSVRLFIACLIDQISLQTFLFIIGVIIEQEVHDKQKLKFRHEYRTWRRRRRKNLLIFLLEFVWSRFRTFDKMSRL